MTLTADEAMTPQGDPEERSAVDDAKQFLSSLLIDGAVTKREIEKDADGAGFSMATIRRAQKALGVEAYRDGFGKGGVWKWRLRAKVLKESIDAHTICVSAFGKDEHLCAEKPKCNEPDWEEF